ncbi:hypothetical protein RhiJN_26916 [Ceratobasidium sp. AG-Ba]|nr:hypothetical protein RhiJN_26916 [Ceratobasidium sp. AG-Ba]
MTGTLSLVDRFQELANSQKDLIADAEREVTVWKNAHRNCDSEIAALKQEIAALKRGKNTSQTDGSNPLLLCLIDGDGCIFNENLLMLGAEGGRDAAFRLRQHIITHYGSNQDLLVHIFFNREGLGKTLKSFLGIQPGTFSAFITGFNTASPLMSMLDVGAGKEAADAKIREQMRIFVRFPHVKKIYFGGGHDNGYTNNLAAIHNEGFLDKVVLLQSYTQLAAEIKALGLPCLGNNGVFLAQKLSSKTASTAHLNSNAPSPAPVINRTRSGSKAPTPSVPAPPPPPSGKIKVPTGKNYKANVATLKVVKPRACNHYYLTRKGCPVGTLCPYGHEYEFSPEMIADLRDLVKQNPCLITVKGQECTDEECPFAHLCPQGRNCDWHKDGKCKFSVPGMHGSPVPSSILGSDEDRVLVAPSFPSMHARNGSSSSNADFTPIPTPSPGKKAAKARQATPTKMVQTKLAFKNSVSGSTQAERLAQMGVIRAGSIRPVFNDDDEESEEAFDRDYPARSYNNAVQYGNYNPRPETYRVID